jgi:hypothetical protein
LGLASSGDAAVVRVAARLNCDNAQLVTPQRPRTRRKFSIALKRRFSPSNERNKTERERNKL